MIDMILGCMKCKLECFNSALPVTGAMDEESKELRSISEVIMNDEFMTMVFDYYIVVVNDDFFGFRNAE